MPPQPRVPRSLRRRPFRGSRAVGDGLLSKEQLRSGCWRRLLPDVYLLRDVAVTHLELCRAVALILPAGAAIGGASAAYLHGADVLFRDEPVEVTIPPHAHIGVRELAAVRHANLALDDVVCCDGVRLTSPVRTAFDLARWREPELEAVVAVDAILTHCHLKVEAIRTYADGHPLLHRTKRLAKVLDLAMPGAESPMESRLRLVLVRAGLPVPALQHKVYHLSDPVGQLVARLDLAYPDRRLGIEYDGGGHFDPEQVKDDLLRQNELRAAGWSLFRFTYDDVIRHPARLLAQVRSALAT